ncbi:hypothetical protein LIER_36883 [Lithospermum erythrorhizon]|uniref:DNA helicase Pif1-like 2B domain-containing protein n=1 Tax=Lithospermum erythrorhizon TaxID=34254 RepID=A0AAV3PD61_LITER
MRAKDDLGFINFLMKIGNGEEPTSDKGNIAIPCPMIIPYTSMEESLELLITYIYPEMEIFQFDPFKMMNDDRAKSAKDEGDYFDYLNTLEPKGLPHDKLVLKINSPIILLRNINPVEGLCNGTRLICKTLLPNIDTSMTMFCYDDKQITRSNIGLRWIISQTTSFLTRTTLCWSVQSKNWKNVKVLIIPPTCNDPGTEYTTNFVYNEVLMKANLS